MSPPLPPDRPSYHHGDLRMQLVAAGLEAVEQMDVDAISLKALATQVGVSQAAPYRHFSSKDDFLSELAAVGFSRLTDSQIAATSHIVQAERLGMACRAYVDFALAHPGCYRLMFHSGLLNRAKAHPLLDARARNAFDWLVDLVRDTGTFIDPVATALFIWSALHGATQLKLAGLMAGPDMAEGQGPDIVANLLRHLSGQASAR